MLLPSANKPTEMTPHSPVGAVHRDRAHRIVDLHLSFDKLDREAHQHARDQPDDDSADGVHEAAGRRDGDQAGQQAVAGHGGVRLAVAQPHVQHGAEGAGHARQHGIHRDAADAQIAVAGSAQRGARIKPEPAEGQDEAAR